MAEQVEGAVARPGGQRSSTPGTAAVLQKSDPALRTWDPVLQTWGPVQSDRATLTHYWSVQRLGDRLGW